jgi:hypothetical protein
VARRDLVTAALNFQSILRRPVFEIFGGVSELVRIVLKAPAHKHLIPARVYLSELPKS